MFDLYGKKIVFFTFFAILPALFWAQIGSHNYNFKDFQAKPYYFGITLGLNSASFKTDRSRQFIDSREIFVANGSSGPGFDLHMIGNMKIGDYFDFRILPGFSLGEKSLEFRDANNTLLTQAKFEGVFAELPFHVRYKSAPYKDKRAFVVAGLKYSYDVASNSKARQADELIKISPHDFQVEVGFGVQFFFPYFIFSPEIKFSQGLGNLLIYDGNLHESTVLEKVLSRALTISFHFEG